MIDPIHIFLGSCNLSAWLLQLHMVVEILWQACIIINILLSTTKLSSEETFVIYNYLVHS